MIWILIGGLLTFLILQSVLLKSGWRRGLEVSVKYTDPYVYEGDKSKLQEVVVNRKWLPVSALEVSMAMSRNLLFEGDAGENTIKTDQTYKRDVFSFLFQEKIIRSLDFVATRRGYYEITEIDLNAYDYLFRNCGFAMVPQLTQMYVYPAQVDTRRLNLLCTAISGMLAVNNQLFPDPFEFSGIREYEPTDPMSKINWKSSARQGKLMVNQFDSTTNLDPVLIFDIEDSRILKQEELVEETIRIVSSLAARMLEKRMPLRIVSNTELNEAFAPGGGKIPKINQMLSCVTSNDRTGLEMLTELSEDLGKMDAGTGSERVFIFVSKNNHEEIVESIRKMAGVTTPFLWVLPRFSYEEDWQPEIPYVRVINWEVKV